MVTCFASFAGLPVALYLAAAHHDTVPASPCAALSSAEKPLRALSWSGSASFPCSLPLLAARARACCPALLLSAVALGLRGLAGRGFGLGCVSVDRCRPSCFAPLRRVASLPLLLLFVSLFALCPPPFRFVSLAPRVALRPLPALVLVRLLFCVSAFWFVSLLACWLVVCVVCLLGGAVSGFGGWLGLCTPLPCLLAPLP